MDIHEYFRRIGFDGSKAKVDLETLTRILQCQLRTVPFENFTIHLGERMKMDLETVYDLVVKKNRGGWCLQVNNLLAWALTEMGFQVTLLGGHVYNTTSEKYNDYMSHLVLTVPVNGKEYLVDAGFGFSAQTWEPMELVSGKEHRQGPSVFRLIEDDGLWHVEQSKRERRFTKNGVVTSKPAQGFVKVFNFTLKPRTTDNFVYINDFLQDYNDDIFATNSLCSLQTEDGVETLVGHTLTCVKYDQNGVDLIDIKRLTDEEVYTELKCRFKLHLEKPFKPKKKDEEDILI
ncbi:N-acetyltransferase family member protein [Theileria equi strain WA]|uniref:arylamine N-acetyltransferase n=1 Tax=Theileria equi strain WA TaxID=1537102 RepID=L1LC19_THEEQ|nr:N-acetyltransferase family member protein [Theileria equi strain WA]EKX72819.1 N-acetyltransferase family member protein [Theileria equi strain WA]|eukprot:XP_004832271.1 N-acetyltransferase family member protein [Theileria equi strain WA]